jgi:hemolysin III
VWVAAIIGIAVRTVWLHAPYPAIAAVYVVVGWSGLIEFNALLAALSSIDVALVVAGGFLYTLGALVYALRWPNPWPAVFGYHEVFHTLVVLAVAAHLVAAFRLVGR